MSLSALNGKSFLWNTIGSVIGAGSSFILLLCVTRSIGAAQGGVFSLAFSSAQLFLTLGKFGIRSYQATDVTRKISTATYLFSRVITCLGMMLLSGIHIAISGYETQKAGIVFAVCLIKLADAVEDVYHGQFQLNDRLDVAGKLLAFRNIITMVIFAGMIFMTHNLLLTCWTTAVLSLLVCISMNWWKLKKIEKFCVSWKWNEIKEISVACFPLFLGTFLSLYIYNVPKYAIDMFCSAEEQTYYAIIFMPTFAINMFSEFVFKPLLTTLASWWKMDELYKLKKGVSKLITNIFIVTVIVLAGMYFWGTNILSMLYNVNVIPYRMELMLLMLGGGCSATVYFLYNVLTAMRMQKQILINYTVGAIIITIIAFLSVKSGGILSASISYLSTEGILCVLMLRSLHMGIECHMTEMRGRKKNNVEND